MPLVIYFFLSYGVRIALADEGAEFTFFDWENFGPTPLYAPITGSTLRQLFVVDDGIVLCLNDGGFHLM